MPPRGVKGRRGKGAGVGGNEAQNLLNAISSSGLDEKEILRIVGADKPPCDHLRSPCGKNKKDNVACFCQLMPAGTSFRKKGLWQKEQSYLGTLGNDPEEKKREEPSQPAGLRNLGNTCYANAALQCLFSIPSLRAGIYGAEPAVAGHDIFRQLQSLFLEMQFGPWRSVDTEALAKTLGLNHGIQQDGQEFMKLLLSRVEQMLGKSSDAAARRLVPRLFRGGLSYVTTCQRCGRDSSSSRDVQDFYDLMPQVRGFSSLTASLASFLHPDLLSGDNRYRCDYCADKVDALRRVRLRSLPPYLCMALQRFYFDPRTCDKAKALDKFSFPLTLDFSTVLAEAAAAEGATAVALGAATVLSSAGNPSSVTVTNGGPNAHTAAAAPPPSSSSSSLETPSYAVEGSPLYELVAILIHKGSQAHSGHYVAHIKDQASGQWWRFDDEVAECIGADPAAAFQADHGGGGGGTAAASVGGGDGGKGGAGTSRKRAPGGGGGGEDPDYDDGDEEDGAPDGPNDDEIDEEDVGTKKGGKGGRRAGSKKRARGAGRSGKSGGRPPKKGKGSGSGGGGGARGGGKARERQGRGSDAAAEGGGGGGSDGEGDLAVALAASMAAAAEDGDGDEDEEVRLAMAASMADPTAGGGSGTGGVDDMEEDAALRAVLEASALETAAAAAPSGGGGGGGDAGTAAGAAARAPPSPTDSDAELAAALKASVADAVAPTPPRLTPRPRPPPAAVVATAVKTEAGDEAHRVPDLLESAATALQQHAEPASPRATGVKAEGAAKPSGPAAATTTTSSSSSACLVSANAYMLVYRAVGLAEAPAPADAAELPEPLQMAASEEAARFAEECDVFQRQREAMKQQVEERRRTVREVLGVITPRLPASDTDPNPERQQQQQQQLGETSAASAASTATAGYWVSASWLEQWANDEAAPPPIDNGPIMCSVHGGGCGGGGGGAGSGGEGSGGEGVGGGGGGVAVARLDPSKVSSAKLVSVEAWGRLHAAHGGGPALAAGDVCRQCLAGSFNEALLGSQAVLVRAQVAAILEAAATVGVAVGADGGAEDYYEGAADEEDEEAEGLGSGGGPRQYWVSKAWLQGWSKRQGASVQLEKSPTADLACPHGQLVTLKHCKRVAVPADVWRFLRDLWRRQRVSEAQDEAARSAAAAAGGAAGAAGKPRGRGRGRQGGGGGGGADAGLDCMDLTGDDAVAAPEAAAGDDDEDEDDDDMEMMEDGPEAGAAAAGGDGGGAAAAAKGPRAAYAVPTSREGTPDPEAPVLPSGANGGAAAAASGGIPTAEELDALCPELPVGRVRECRACREAAGQAAEAQAGSKRQLDLEKAALGGLKVETIPTLEPGGRYYMVPSAWVHEWQQYVRGAPKPATGGKAAGRPGPLADAMLRMLCPCHPNEPRLGVPPPRLTQNKRNKLCQQDLDTDALRLIFPEDWTQLCRLYRVPGAGAVAAAGNRSAAAGGVRGSRLAALRAADAIANGLAAGGSGSGGADSDGDFAVAGDHNLGPDGAAEGPSGAGGVDAARMASIAQGFVAEVTMASSADGDAGAGPSTAPAPRGGRRRAPAADRDGGEQPLLLPELQVWPPVCWEALAEQGRAAREAALAYSDAELMVELVVAELLDSAFQEGGNERRSKRSRKGRTAIKVSNTTTLEQLKLQIYENLSVHPKNQLIYVRGDGGLPQELLGDDLSLAQHEVLPGAEVRVVRVAVVDDDEDMAGLLGSAGRSKQRQVEEGFKNTALHGDLPQQQQHGQRQHNSVAEAAASTISDEVFSEG